jgi:hypothetical protein
MKTRINSVDNFVTIFFILFSVFGLCSTGKADAAWTVEFVDHPRIIDSSSIAVDSTGSPHMAYGGDHLYHAYYNGTSWIYETVDDSLFVGRSTSIAVDSNDKAHISYLDGTNEDLKFATNASGIWVTTTVDASGDVGYDTSIAVDSNDKAHISYYGGLTGDLKHATNAEKTVDSTPPVIAISGCPVQVYLNDSASVEVSVTDSESGVGSQSAPDGANTLDTSTVGTMTFTVNAEDNAGNTASESCTYSVIYDFTGAGGFQPPVDNPPTLNVAKAGSTVSMKWQLPDGQGGFISDIGAVSSIKFQQVDCGAIPTALDNPVNDATPSGGSGLRYDYTTNQFVFNWWTSKFWAGYCYVLDLRLDDDSHHYANFQFN